MRQMLGMLQCILEVRAVLDQLDPTRTHRLVFLAAIAMRYDYDSVQAIALCGEGNALPVISAGRGYDTGDFRVVAFQLLEVDQASPDLEGA